MRQDYFNLREASNALHVGYETLQKIITGMPDFPAYRTTPTSNWIIPKKQFFAWFDRPDNCAMLCDKFGISMLRHIEHVKEQAITYKMQMARRTTLRRALREEERNRMYKTHLEF